MWRTEVTVGALTWVFCTARISVGPGPVAEFETTIMGPGGQIAKPVRHCVAEERARQVHEALVADFAGRTGAMIVESAARHGQRS